MLILIGSFLALLLLGLPVALSMAVSSLIYITATGTAPDVILAQRMIAGVESFPLLAVPFFILAGNLMNIAGITGRIYNFAVALDPSSFGSPNAAARMATPAQNTSMTEPRTMPITCHGPSPRRGGKAWVG